MRTFPSWDIRHGDAYGSVLDALLEGRGLTLEDLQVGPEALQSPQLLKDLDQGVERIAQAVRQGEKILVYGDYDADGVTSTTLMLDCLQQVGGDCDYMLPDRHRDGYGIKPPAVEEALKRRAGLVITVDNGISAYDALQEAQAQGLDVVVVDHHQQLGELPPAHSVINPNRIDCPYPFKHLAGVGVAFKVAQALTEGFMDAAARRRYLNSLLDLVALGTVADVMPVLGENRVLVQRGLQVMEKTRRPGLQQLKAVAGCAEGPLQTEALGFYLGPRINVAGRLQTADLALRLLRAQSSGQAAQLAEELNQLNTRRKTMQRQAQDEANALIAAEDLASDRVLVLLGEAWHMGVIGLIAGRLCEAHHRPVVVCTDERGDGTYVGSARSIPGYDISAGIDACAEFMFNNQYGGHAGAAGFTLKGDCFEAFRMRLLEHAAEHLSPEDLQPRLEVDLKLRPEDVCAATIDQLDVLEPCGNGNQRPVFAVEGCTVVAVRRIGKDNSHLKINFKIGQRSCAALWWGKGEVADQLHPGQRLDAAFALELDTYTGNGAVQMVLKDLCPAGEAQAVEAPAAAGQLQA